MKDLAGDDIPPSFVSPHDGRELQLMLEGKKHLSMFLVDDFVEDEDYPDKRFDAFTREGRFVKGVRVEKVTLFDGVEVNTRRILYATASVLYLASDASRYVTGTELVIDGGMNAGGVARRT